MKFKITMSIIILIYTLCFVADERSYENLRYVRKCQQLKEYRFVLRQLDAYGKKDSEIFKHIFLKATAIDKELREMDSKTETIHRPNFNY